MTDKFVSLMIWWFSVFGVNDWTYVKLGLTLIASAALVVVLWLAVLIAVGLIGAMVALSKGNRA